MKRIKRYKTEINDNSVIIIFLLILLLLSSFGFGHMGGMMFFGPVFMILVLVLIVWLIVSLTQNK